MALARAERWGEGERPWDVREGTGASSAALAKPTIHLLIRTVFKFMKHRIRKKSTYI